MFPWGRYHVHWRVLVEPYALLGVIPCVLESLVDTLRSLGAISNDNDDEEDRHKQVKSCLTSLQWHTRSSKVIFIDDTSDSLSDDFKGVEFVSEP